MAYGDLTTLADVKAWLQTSQSAFPPTDDALLSRLITTASQYIQTWNGMNVGTMVFAAAATTATFAMTSATTFNAGDVLTLVAPAVPDATLANLAWTFMGTMGA